MNKISGLHVLLSISLILNGMFVVSGMKIKEGDLLLSGKRFDKDRQLRCDIFMATKGWYPYLPKKWYAIERGALYPKELAFKPID
jgi:hypothetical protein